VAGDQIFQFRHDRQSTSDLGFTCTVRSRCDGDPYKSAPEGVERLQRLPLGIHRRPGVHVLGDRKRPSREPPRERVGSALAAQLGVTRRAGRIWPSELLRETPGQATCGQLGVTSRASRFGYAVEWSRLIELQIEGSVG